MVTGGQTKVQFGTHRSGRMVDDVNPIEIPLSSPTGARPMTLLPPQCKHVPTFSKMPAYKDAAR